eukprot:Skav202850  [mRNA]  locus=scaffold2311:96539:109796:+ [translate_table: standard]
MAGAPVHSATLDFLRESMEDEVPQGPCGLQIRHRRWGRYGRRIRIASWEDASVSTDKVLPLLRCPPMCGPVMVEKNVGGIQSSDPAESKHDDEELIRTGAGPGQVPFLLERMNDAATDLNRLELELTGAEAKHKNALVTWSRLYDELRSRHGSVSGAMDHAKPYYEALHKCQAATCIAREAKRQWKIRRSSLKAEEQKEAPEVQCLRTLRQEVQSCEEEFQSASKALETARAELQAQREKVGTATIKSARPCSLDADSKSAVQSVRSRGAEVESGCAFCCRSAWSGAMELSSIMSKVMPPRFPWRVRCGG